MIAGGASAKVTLPRFFTDNMVVQQNSVLTLPGTAEPMSQVTVRTDWSDDVVKTKAGKDGRFSVTLPTPAAGGPYTLIVSDGTGDNTVLSNVLSGEVWLCSGQSNMEYPVKGWTQVMNADEVVATAQHPDIRLLQVRKNIYNPQNEMFTEGKTKRMFGKNETYLNLQSSGAVSRCLTGPYPAL